MPQAAEMIMCLKLNKPVIVDLRPEIVQSLRQGLSVLCVLAQQPVLTEGPLFLFGIFGLNFIMAREQAECWIFCIGASLYLWPLHCSGAGF